MSRQSRDTYGFRSRRRKGGLIYIFDLIVFILTLLAGVLLVCAYLSQFINPAKAWFFAFAGMGAPILYMVNLILALYWIIRWKRFAFVPVAVLVMGISWISLFFRPSLSKHSADNKSATTVVMSYNVAGFLSDPRLGPTVSTLDSISAFISVEDPDILCIQEFQCTHGRNKHHIDSLIGLPHNVYNYKVPNRNEGGWGLAIYSRYRILDSGVVDFEGTTNSAMWADLLVRKDTVRVFNCHLQTTAVNHSDLEYIVKQEYLGDEGDREDRVRSIAGKLKRNFIIRARQADSLAPMIAGSPHRVVVCGDFNDTPMSYVYKRMRGGLTDTFTQKGSGIPSTYKGLFNLFRIDYILHSRDIRTVSYDNPQNDYSDHRPVVAGLDI